MTAIESRQDELERRRTAFNIAGRARAYALMARRPELLTGDRQRRLEHAMSLGGPHLFEAGLIVTATHVDLVCANAVRLLSQRFSRELLEVLEDIEMERICAVYFALPEERRRSLLENHTWFRYVHEVEEDVQMALGDLEGLIVATPDSEIGRELAWLSLDGSPEESGLDSYELQSIKALAV